ncbi:MAG: hypothetical protein ACR2KJ_11955 [Jatrophihabitans sp.]
MISAPDSSRKFRQIDNDVADIYTALRDVSVDLHRQQNRLAELAEDMDQHTATLDQHTATLDQHTVALSGLQTDMTEVLTILRGDAPRPA